jgi:hypothetical protein
VKTSGDDASKNPRDGAWNRKAKVAAAFVALFVLGVAVSAALGAAGPLGIATTSESTTASTADKSSSAATSSSSSTTTTSDTATAGTTTASACSTGAEQISAGYFDGNLVVDGSGFPGLCDLEIEALNPGGTTDHGTVTTNVDGTFTYRAPLENVTGVYQVDAIDMSGATLASTSFELGVSGATTSLIVKLASGLSSSEQDAIIARDGGTEIKTIAPLRLHVVQVSTSDADSTLQAYQSDDQVVSAELDRTREARGEPADPGYASQWALPKIGWDKVYGNVHSDGSARIAVLDTGVSSANGDVNVGAGWSAFGTDPSNDPNGHGTWVSSIAAAAAGNATGIAGVDYAPTTVLPVQVLDANGVGQDSDIIDGVVWAADNGADVILMSFSNPGYSPALQDAVDYAWSQGAVIVAATGNDAVSTPTFPAGDAGVIGVAGTDENDALVSSSNYGQDTFLAAPGVGIAADAPSGDVASVSGTSAAAAIVAGAAALLKANGAGSNGVIVGRLARTADPAGTTDQTGNGRLNLERAIADDSTDAVKPNGAAPVGGGGPVVGPYTIAAVTFNSVFPADATSYTTPNYNAGNGGATADVGTTVSWGGGTTGHAMSFSIKRNSDGTYWNGTAFSGTTETFNAATSCSGTGCASGNNPATYLYNFAPSEGSYTVRARATDDNQCKSPTFCFSSTTGNTFAIDNTSPVTASVTAPVNGNTYGAATVPATFSGSAADNNANSAGLATNSTTFTLQRPNGDYWNSTTLAWQAAAFNLATTHASQSGATAVTWNDNVTLPTWSSQPSGTYTVQAKATDKAGNTFTGTAVSFTLDSTAPTVTIDAATPNPTTSGTTVTWHASENGTYSVRVGGTDCATGTSVDSGSYTTPNSVVTSISAGQLAEGSNTIRVCDTDVSTNVGSATATVTKDSVAPTVSSINRQSPGTSSTNATSVTFHVTFSEAVTGVDSNDFSTTTTGTVGGTVVNPIAPVSSSIYDVTVSAIFGVGTLRLDLNGSGTGITDTIGNPISSGFTIGQTYSIDTVAPNTPTVTSPTTAVTVNAASFTVTGTAEANALIRLWTDGNNNGIKDAGDTTLRGSQQLSGGATAYSISVTLTQNAANDLIVTATDAAGNEGAAADVPRITEDSLAPAAPSTPDLDPASDSGSSSTDNNTNDNTPTFNGTAEANSTVELFRGGTTSLGTTTADGSGNWSKTVAALVDGTYSITARAIDAANNTSAASAALSITIDTAAPTVTLGAPSATATSSGPVTYAVTYTSATAVTLAAGDVTSNKTGTADATVAVSGTGTTTRTVTLSAISGDGTLGISLGAGTASDTAGNTAAAAGASTTFAVDNTAPTTASLTTPADGGSFRAATVPTTFSGSAADNTGGVGLASNSSTFTLQRGSDNFYWNGSNWQSAVFNLGTTHAVTTGNTSVTWNDSVTLPTWSDGTYTVQAKATDKVGNTFTGAASTFTVDASAPTAAITYSPTGPVKAGTSLVITATFSEPMATSPAPKIAISGANTLLAADMTKVDSTHYTYSHTVGAGNGTATVALSTGTDIAGNVVTSAPTSGATFTVDNAAPTAAITYSPTGGVTQGTSLTITATFNEAMATSPTPKISISGANTLAATDMTRVDSTHYTYTHTVGAGSGSATVSLSVGTDLAGNVVTAAPTSGGTFTVVGPATRIALSATAGNLAAGTTRVITATIQDANGNTVSSGPDSALTVDFSQSAGTGSVTGLGSFTATNGVATDTVTGAAAGSVSISAAATAAGGSIASVSPLTFTVVVGAASKLAFTTQPSDGTDGQPLQTQPVVTVQDAGGNTVTSSNVSITLAIAPGTPTSGGPGTLTCTTNPRSAVNGVDTFSGCSINTTGAAYKLRATASGLTLADSAPFNITLGEPTTTSISCVPNSIAVGGGSTCTATVTDGTNPNIPTGGISWGSTGGGTFSSNSCALANVGGQYRCSVNLFAPTTVQTLAVTGSYSGDANYAKSNGSANVSVAACTTNKICIEGNMADWDALTTTPSFPDGNSDAGGGSTDITGIRITAGEGNLYVRWDIVLTQNKNEIDSASYAMLVDSNHDGTPDGKVWVMFDSHGAATTALEMPLGAQKIAVGMAQQSCFYPDPLVSDCTSGGVAQIEASFPLTALNPSGSLVGLQTETHASADGGSQIKDCVPGTGQAVCNGYFKLDVDTGTVIVESGHATATSITCADGTRNLNQPTTCTVTVTDTGFDTSTPPQAVTKANPTGTVVFFVSNGNGTFTPASCSLSPKGATTDQSTCTATITYTPTATAGTHTLTATYGGGTLTPQFAGSSNSTTLSVTKRTTSTTVSCSPGAAIIGGSPSSTTCTAVVSDTAAGTKSPPSGTVTFSSNLGGTFGTTTCSVVSGNLSCSATFTPTATGTHTITASYAGSNTHLASSNTTTVSVTSATRNTTTTITSNNDPSTYGQSVTFTATVSAAAGDPGANGTVTFKSDGVAIAGCSNVPLNASSQATCTTSALKAVGSPHSITAEYGGATSGGTTWNASTGGPLSQAVNQRALTVTATGVNKVYDGTAAATVTLSDNRVAGDVFTDSYTSASFANKNVGTGKAVSVSGISISGSDAGNYTFNTTASTTADISARPITVTAATNTRIYDGTTSAAATPSITFGALQGTDSATFSEVYSDKNVGTGKTLLPSASISDGNGGNNYAVTYVSDTTGVIAARMLTISATADNKFYDGTSAATAHLTDNRIAGDVFTDGYTSATFANKNVGTGKTVDVSAISISGTDAGNYTFNTTTTATADILARSITVTAATNTKTYDGTASAAATPTVTAGSIAPGDTGSFTEVYATKAVGTGKTLTPSGSVSDGNGGNNYFIAFVNNTTGVITARALTVSASGTNKVYDGTTSAAVTLSDDRVAGDVFTDSYASASFADKNVGTGKTVSVSGISTSGADAGNYTFNTTASTSANITARVLAVSAHGVNKVYDGTATATVALTDDRIAGDAFTDSYAGASFNNKNVGTAKPVSVSGISISGTDAGNYAFNTTASTTADITARALTIAAHGVNKVYDGTTTATVTLTDDRVAGDVFANSYGSALFNNKNVGLAKPVSVTGIFISGTDAGNYNQLNTAASTSANITPRALTISAHGVNKVYDGTTAATVALSDDRVAGDVFTDSYTSATFSDKNIGAGKTVTVAGTSISGTDAGNYTFNTTATTTADITARALTITAHGVNKVYDGTTSATVTLSDNRVAGDLFTDSYTGASFANKNVGTGKTVSVSGLSISGADAGNYSFNTTASTTADITARALTISATGVDKVYDGTTTASVTLSDDRVSGDVFTDSYASAFFSNKNVGTAKPVSVTGLSILGTDAGNYSFNTTASTTADITARTLTITATGVNKVYDGSTSATVTLSDNRVAGDVFTDSYTSASFSDKNVGTGETVTVNGISISGTDAGNYTFNTTTTTTANVTKRYLTIVATGVDKVYDGTTFASVTLSDNRVAGDVFTASYTGASFANKNVGTGKTVSVSGISISGADAGNYTFNTTASTTADITARALAVTAHGVDKVYDAGTSATVILSDDRVAGDVFTDSYTAASFVDKNVGTGKTVTVTGISISGADAGNYTFNTTAATTADTTARALHITATGQTRAYDGTTSALVFLSDDKVSGDDVTTHYGSASFADKNAGTGKTVTVIGITITGADIGNYAYNTSTTTTADVTARALTIAATGMNRVYDGTTTATVTLSDNRIGGDVFTDAYTSASFANKNVGIGTSVSVTGISISGTDAGNYTFDTTATTTADITARTLHITATGVNKIYDGTTAAAVTLSDNRVSGDVFTDSYSSATFSDENVGTGKAVSVSGISISGTDTGNYTFNTSTTTTANITKRYLTITASGVNRVYDATTFATVTLSDNRVAGDVFTDSYTSATFADRNVGIGKSVSVTGISISGTDAGNYSFNTTAATTANITQRDLTVTATGVNKVYDGTTLAAVNLSTDEVVGDMVFAGYTSASFADKNVGTAKAVSVSGISLGGMDAPNYHLVNTTASTAADITARPLHISATGVNKVYDGMSAATVTLSDDRVSGDLFTDSYSSASFAGKNVGTGKALSVIGISISGTDAGNYTSNTTATTTASITKRYLTVSATGVNKVYDGTAAATVTFSDNRVSGDVFTDSYTAASFADKNVGTAKPVSVTGISIAGTDAGNYSFNTTASTTADITARTLTITATGINKVYDGGTSAMVTVSDDRVSGDSFTDSYTSATFNNKNVGTAKPVSVTGISIAGTDAGNYTFNTTATTTAHITARALHVTATAQNKVYNGTTSATVFLGDDRASGDDVSPSYGSASFADKNVGTGKVVTVTGISISGTDAGNYSFNTSTTTTANITKRYLTITATGVNKAYDGIATATVTLSDNRVAGDVVTDSYTSAAFDNKNVGTAKPLSVSGISISGSDAGNYSFNTTASTTADITARALTIGATGVSKVYDGSASATVTLSDSRVAGDVFTDSYMTATFADKNVGTGKTVSVSGISISGTDAGNYTFNPTATTTADITARSLTVSAHADDKVYDGSTTASVALLDNRVSGDDLSLSYTTATFANKNVGTGKTVTVSGISISSGADAGNYALSNTSTTATASITARALTVTVAGVNKVYDGTTTATATLSDNRVSGDVFTDSYTSASFNNKNVAKSKPVSVSGISISGTDAVNYTFNTTASTAADITARPLTVTATGVNKIYDGTTAATVSLSDNRLSGDLLTDGYTSATFSDKNVGTGKTVTANGISISGTDAGNYTYNTTATTTASITKRYLTITATGVSKVYDGTTFASVTLSDNRVSGDVLTASYTNAAFADKNVGTSKLVTVTGISISGPDAGNYSFNISAMTTASIAQRPLTVSASGVNKTYDGTTAATVTLSDDRVLGDVLTDSYTAASFADKNVGTGKAVSVSGISTSGTDAGNYSLNNTAAAATAHITARPLTISATGVNKVYDGTTAATVTLSDNRVSGDVFTDSYTTAQFVDKNVGTGKTVNVSGISISGADAGNYTFNTTTTTTGNVTAKAVYGSFTASNKVYDSTTSASILAGSLTGRVAGETATQVDLAGGTATFNNKNVGTAKTVTGTGFTLSGSGATNYQLASSTLTTTADITQRSLTVTATGVNKVYDGTTAATVTLSDNRVTGDFFTDSYTSASFADPNVANTKSVSVSGISISGTDAANYSLVNTTSTTTANITAAGTTTRVALSQATIQYSDMETVTANVTYAGSGNPEGTVQFKIGASNLGVPQALSGGFASLTYKVDQAAGSYTIAAVYAPSTGNWNSSTSGAQTLTVKQEDASIDYTGDTIGLAGSAVNLRATVVDSAAAGYSGANPETTAGTIGDLTKMYVVFDIFTGTSCGTGTPTTTVAALVSDGATLNDGIGVATSTYTSSTEASYCVIARVVTSSGGTPNLYYTPGSNAEAAVITFYKNTGQFVTGGGWINDPAGGGNGHGNFGFNARFNNNGQPQGQMVYVYRGLYNGVPADYRIKSNSLTLLGFSCWNAGLVPAPGYDVCPLGNATFPAKANLQGKSTIQINRASDGYVLYSDGNSTFNATVIDSGASSGIGSDRFQLIVYDKNSVIYKQAGDLGGPAPYFNALTLQGGNVVIHGTTK